MGSRAPYVAPPEPLATRAGAPAKISHAESPVVWRKALYVAASLLAALILFLGGGRLMLEALERQFIYFPAREREDAPTPRLRHAREVEEVWLDVDGVRVHGLHARRDDPLGTLLFFHGNAGNLYDRLGNVELLLGMGLDVLIIDYRGYGKSGGEPSEAGLYADGMAAYRFLTEERGVAPSDLVLFGRSLGSAVAIELATRVPIGALIVESAFTSARDLAREHYGFLPGMLIRSMTHEFDSISKVESVHVPILFVHGDRDSIVPERMGRRLFEAAPASKAWYGIEGAGHNDMVAVGGGNYVRHLDAFLREHLRGAL